VSLDKKVNIIIAFVALLGITALSVFSSFEAVSSLADARQYEKTQREELVLFRSLFLHSATNMKKDELVQFLKQNAKAVDFFKDDGDELEAAGLVFKIRDGVVSDVILQE